MIHLLTQPFPHQEGADIRLDDEPPQLISSHDRPEKSKKALPRRILPFGTN